MITTSMASTRLNAYSWYNGDCVGYTFKRDGEYSRTGQFINGRRYRDNELPVIHARYKSCGLPKAFLQWNVKGFMYPAQTGSVSGRCFCVVIDVYKSSFYLIESAFVLQERREERILCNKNGERRKTFMGYELHEVHEDLLEHCPCPRQQRSIQRGRFSKEVLYKYGFLNRWDFTPVPALEWKNIVTWSSGKSKYFNITDDPDWCIEHKHPPPVTQVQFKNYLYEELKKSGINEKELIEVGDEYRKARDRWIELEQGKNKESVKN